MLYAKETLMMDFHSYAAFFALSPETQAEVDRRLREDVERIAVKQAKIDVKRVVKELERVDIAIVTQALMKPTAAKLKVHQRQQQGDRVDYLLLRINQECGSPWSTCEELREILRIYPRASGRV